MDKELLPHKQSLELKELGFDEPCFGRYYYKESYPMLNPNSGETELVFEFGQYIKQTEITILAPLYQQAFRFFREKYNLYAELYTANMGAIEYCFQIRDLYSEKYIYDNFQGAGSSYVGTFNTPEEAELACLDKLIEIFKTK
jgi:hypothetical protein